MQNARDNKGYLKRLPALYYQRAAWVHWVMTIDGRCRGWLDELMHAYVREGLLQAFARYALVCPVYCLMPDHAHFIWCGCAERSDQRKACGFFRKMWNSRLRERGFSLQRQGYDDVLLENERNADAFEDACVYIMKNPEREKLVLHWKDWPYCGSVVPGYPRMDPREGRYWQRFWTAYNELREPGLL